MKIGVFVFLAFVLSVFIFAVYLLWQNLPKEPVDYSVLFSAKENFSYNSELQFYPNMRYTNRSISYWLETECDNKKAEQVLRSFNILSSKTLLNFYSSQEDKAEILIYCSEIPIEPNAKDHYIAGEGGPIQILNASKYSIILRGKVSIYRNEKCKEPKVALHEILHALGFDHINNPKSIMYNYTDCDEQIDDIIINRINELYSVESRPELVISEISATRAGKYLNFKISVANQGLQSSINSSLDVFGKEKIKTFDLGIIDIGSVKTLNVSNLRMREEPDRILFIVYSQQPELTDINNRAELSIK